MKVVTLLYKYLITSHGDLWLCIKIVALIMQWHTGKYFVQNANDSKFIYSRIISIILFFWVWLNLDNDLNHNSTFHK